MHEGPHFAGDGVRITDDGAGIDAALNEHDHVAERAESEGHVVGLRCELLQGPMEHHVVEVRVGQPVLEVDDADGLQIGEGISGSGHRVLAVAQPTEALEVHRPDDLLLGAEQAVDGRGRRADLASDAAGAQRVWTLVGQQAGRRLDQLGAHGVVVDFRARHLDRVVRDGVT